MIDPSVISFLILLSGTVLIFVGVIVGAALFENRDDIMRYFKERKRAKREFILAQKKLELEAAKIQKEKEIKKARIEDAYWRGMSGLPKSGTVPITSHKEKA